MIFKNYPEIVLTHSNSSAGNMSFSKGDPKIALANRKAFLKKNNLSLDQIVKLYVKHGSKVVSVGKKDLGKGAFDLESGIKSDALITNQANVFLMLPSADCMPIAIFDPKNKIISLIHGSKKSLEKGIIENTISKISKKFKSTPSNLIIHIGPSIGPCCYYLNIWSDAIQRLKRTGVLEKNIENSKVCTYHENVYFSHSKSFNQKLKNDFRFITILGMKK